MTQAASWRLRLPPDRPLAMLLSVHAVATSWWTLVAALLVVLAPAVVGCERADPGAPESVADAFADAYFVRANQEEALKHAALGMAKQLEKEILDTQAIRSKGYGPEQASPSARVERRGRSEREGRVRFEYSVRVGGSAAANEKRADVELARIDGNWKVVRVGLADAPTTPDE